MRWNLKFFGYHTAVCVGKKEQRLSAGKMQVRDWLRAEGLVLNRSMRLCRAACC